MKLRTIMIAVAALAAAAAFGQTIPTPASSVYSNAKAVVSITPVDTSQFATQTQLNSVANTASSAYYYGTTAYNTANTANATANSAYWYGTTAYNTANAAYAQSRPWSQYFPGQQKAVSVDCSGGGGIYSTFYAYIDGSGYVYWHDGWAHPSWIGVGYPYANSPINFLAGNCGITVAPSETGTSSGTPSGWKLVASPKGTWSPAGP